MSLLPITDPDKVTPDVDVVNGQSWREWIESIEPPFCYFCGKEQEVLHYATTGRSVTYGCPTPGCRECATVSRPR